MQAIIQQLQTLINTNQKSIDAWFAEQYRQVKPLFYSSVDLRHSGFKLAPVDTNLFPAGFNNLSSDAKTRASQAIRRFLDQYYPDCNTVLLIPESHTRNTHYMDNVATLQSLLKNAGKTVVLGSTIPDLAAPLDLTSASGHVLHIEPLILEGNTLRTPHGVIPDLVVLNNDLTTGIPDILQTITQPIIPSMDMGWHVRRKSSHFSSYTSVVRHFAERFTIDPWLISTLFQQCGAIDFKSRSGMECVALAVEQVLHGLRQKYQEYGIDEQPYVFIKSDMGTYGMGIMTARSGEELFSLNKNIRKRMEVVKGGVVNTEVIIQEGIPTIDTVNGKTAEPFIYLIGNEPVGCLYRVNEEKSAYANLNSPGMTFERADCDNASPCQKSPQGLIARFAALAAAKEGV